MAMRPPVATLLQSAVCRTTAAHRPWPTMFTFPGLTSKPVWSREAVRRAFPWVDDLEAPHNMDTLRRELRGLRAAGTESDYSTADSTREDGEHKMHEGGWSWHSFVVQGQHRPQFRELCPGTSAVLDNVVGGDLMLGTPFSFAFFSTLHAQSAIQPHTAACNLRLRFHLPLEVPPAARQEGAPGRPKTGMRVADELCVWEEGKSLVFDDSYEHEVWNNTDAERVLLLFDVWHPDLTFGERRAIVDMFNLAKEKGWLKQ